MNKYKYIIIVLCCVVLCSNCSKDNLSQDSSLAAFVEGNILNIDNIIACASSSKTDRQTVSVYFYPRPGASDFRYFETNNSDDNKDDYTKYQQIESTPIDLFLGYLKKFDITTANEKWVIVTFMEDDELHLSNPYSA